MTPPSFPFAEVFHAVERQVIALGSPHVGSEAVRAYLDSFKTFATRELDDDGYFSILVMVAFYSGFKAATVSHKLGVIRQHFPNWKTVAAYGEADIRRILDDEAMIRHEGKVRGCVENARRFEELVRRHGSFKAFVAHHLPTDSFEELLLFKELLETTFAYLGGVTAYHFMTDIGLNVLKPDRVICRIFKRLDLLESEGQLLKAIFQGRQFATSTGLPIRYIDIVLVLFGQVASPQVGIARGICLDVPNCTPCAIRSKCRAGSTQGEVDPEWEWAESRTGQ